MGEKRRRMPDKLPDIKSNNNRGFHGFSNQLAVEDVDIQFENDKKQEPLPDILHNGILANQRPLGVGSRKTSRQKTFLTLVDEDDNIYDENQVGEVVKIPGDDRFCNRCAEKAAMEAGKLTEKIIELKLETERQKLQFETTKRKLDNTSKELKTAQAMIETLKLQNTEKANRIANLHREATIGLWNREKKKLLQFADVREASLEYELESLKNTSTNFKDRALDRIQFLHEQVYKLKLRLNLSNSGGLMTKALESAEKKLSSTKEELDTQKENFFKYRRNMVGMLAGFHKDFRFLTEQVDCQTYEVNADFFDHAEQYEDMLNNLHKAALTDNLSETVETLPPHFMLSESQKGELMKRQPQRKPKKDDRGSQEEDYNDQLAREGSFSEEDMLKQLEGIEHALQQSSKELREFDEKIPDMNDINDSGISLNDYDNMSTRNDSGARLSTPGSSVDKVVRFEDTEPQPAETIENKWKKRRNIAGRNRTPPVQTETHDKCVQTDFLPAEISSPQQTRKGKRSKKSKSGSRSASPKKLPKKVDAAVRLKQEQEVQKQWFAAQKSKIVSGSPAPQSKKRGSTKDQKNQHQNANLTFTHLRDMYGEKRVSNLIDRTTGAVDIDTAADTFPNLTRSDIIEGFTHFVQYDSNNDYRLDMKEVVRAISRTTDQVIDPEEVKAALFELGVLETDELDFFDFLCIQETLSTGTFDSSKSQMLRMQDNPGSEKKATVSKYCAVM